MRARLGCRKVVGGASEGEWRWVYSERSKDVINKNKNKKQMLLLDGKKRSQRRSDLNMLFI